MAEIPLVYNFDNETGEILSSRTARLDPREGTPLVPRLATIDEPPTPDAGQVAAYVDGAWALVEDHRGETVYDKATGEEMQVKTIGPLLDTVTTDKWPGEGFAWISGAWDVDPDYVPPPPPSYRDKRKAAYISELGEKPDFTEAVGDVLDDLIREVRALAVEPKTPEFATLSAKIDAIKARFPK